MEKTNHFLAGRAPAVGDPIPLGSGASRMASYPTGCAGRSPQATGLDLSLGHIGTSGDVHEVDIVNFGPYAVMLDYGQMTVEVDFDSLFPTSRQIRRAEKRKVDRLVAEACRSGMVLLRGETPVSLDVRSEDEQ